MQRKVVGGGTITDDDLHSASGNLLFVIVSFAMPSGRAVQLRRVYDGDQVAVDRASAVPAYFEHARRSRARAPG